MKIKTGLALLGVMTLLGGSLLLANNQVQETKATDTTVGFESSEGFVAKDVYNNTTLYTTGNTGYKWSTFFGCPSIGSQTIPPISGSQSLQLRYYTDDDEAGYSYMEYKVSGIQKVTFKAYSPEALTLKVYQSTSIGESFTNPSSYILTSEVATYTYTITGTSDISLKFEMDISVAPSNKAKIVLDDVTFVTKSSDPTISLDKIDVITYNYEHDITFTSTAENMVGEITYEWSIVSDPNNCITLVDSASSSQTISIASKFGEATIKVYALDSEANEAEVSTTITVRESV